MVDCSPIMDQGADVIRLQKGEQHYEVYYHNGIGSDKVGFSVPGTWTLCLDDVVIKATVVIGQRPTWQNGEEIIHVEVVEGNLQPIPPVMAVIDGEFVIIILYPPMF